MSLEPIVNSLYHLKEKNAAKTLLEAFYRHAFSYEEYDDLAKCAFKIKEYQMAIKYGEDALTNALTNEKMWTARSNLINVYNHANYPENAMRLIKANEAVIPDDTEIKLRVSGREDQYLVSLDSRIASVKNESVLTIKKTDFKIKMVEIPGETFLKTLRNKLLWGEDKRN